MNFVISDDTYLLNKFNIFEYIGNKLEINLHEYFYESGEDTYLKTKIYKRTRFSKKGYKDNHIVPNKKTKYHSYLVSLFGTI